MQIILFLVAILPIVLICFYIYKKDKNKEPIKLLLKLFFSGILSCFLVLIISLLLSLFFPFFSEDVTTLNLFELIIYVFIGVALIEELCKWIMSYKISYNDIDFDQIYDMIIYCVFVSLGFACFENLLYVFEHGLGTGLIRAVLSVPGHACDGVFMGYYLGLAKISDLNNNQKLKSKNLILSLLVPVTLHGIFDYCLFVGNILFVILFFIFVIILYIFSIKKIRKISSITRKMKYKDKYCPNCGIAVNSDFCSNCGRKNE